jgi:hypothetical protein
MHGKKDSGQSGKETHRQKERRENKQRAHSKGEHPKASIESGH